MAWWNFFRKGKKNKRAEPQEKQIITRVLDTPPLDQKSLLKFPRSTIKPLNDKDILIIKKIETELLSAGVLAPKEGSFDITERLEDILDAVNAQGLENVKGLIRDQDLDELLSSSTGGENLLLDDSDDDETLELPEEDYSPLLDVEPRNDEGSVALRLPNGETIYGHVPGT